MDNPILDDYGFIKFGYSEGRRLQDDTGAFDYDLDIPRDNYPVNVFGYPIDGEMEMDNIFVSTKDFHMICHRMFQIPSRW